MGWFECLIHKKGSRNHPLSDSSKELKRVKSAIRAYDEHLFSSMTMSMGGKLISMIGLRGPSHGWVSKI